MPDAHAIAVLVLTLFALTLFTRDKIPLQTSALVVLCLLAIGFVIFPYEYFNKALNKVVEVNPVDFFHGFGHEALIAVCALMIVGNGLVRTGSLEPIGNVLSNMWKLSPSISLLMTLLISAGLSAFINNTPIVVLLIPILVSVALSTKSNPSALLMPMGFASLIGGMSTTIGTSTNLLVVSVANDLGLPTMGVFDFALPALICSVVGIAFLWLVAPKMLPQRDLPLSDTNNRVFTAHLLIREGSSAIGKTLGDLAKATNDDLSVVKIRRTNSVVMPLPDVVIREGDKLLVHDTPEKLKEFEKEIDAVLYAKDQRVDDDNPLNDEDQIVIEIIVDQRSPLLGKTLQSTHFIETYKMIALAVHRGGDQIRSMPGGLGNFPLQLGDILLAQGKREDIDNLKSRHEFLILDSLMEVPLSQKAPIALMIMFGVIFFAAVGLVPIAVSAVIGVLAMLLTSCLNWQDVGKALNIPVIMIVVSSLALGEAMTVTGASEFVANSFVAVTNGAPPPVILSGLILLMAIFTNVVSNNAAAVIGTPIAVSIATTLNLNPEPFVLAVLFGANMSYATPMAYKTNLLIMSAGNYTFKDFLRVGLPLMFIMWLSYSIVLPLLYTL
ncbi:SLC13 family permease [Leucothrix mucor]|uniref:SLC13 family permease n=1 Tax=Leucothrix mucor TaxID=45248 RepID=UPI0003B66C8F|nr:SLC13 family permease [Leucothrix mucor]